MNKSNFLLMLLASCVFFLPACKEMAEGDHDHDHAHDVNMDSVKAQIYMLESNFAKASNAKDVEGVAVYYSDDAESMAPGEPTRVGKAAIKAGIKKDIESDTTGSTISFTTTGLWAGGNYATETGTMTITDKAGKAEQIGKYMTLFELRNGQYIAIRDMWNLDKPENPPATHTHPTN